MTTAKDLFIIAIGPTPQHAVGQGDLSLALAGAELVDLIGAGVVSVDEDHIVAGGASAPDDRLLAEAAAQLVRQPPHELVEDWLWRRGRDLAATYQADLEGNGDLASKRSGRLPFSPQRVVPADTPVHRRAADRWQRKEPVLTALASVLGISHEGSDDEPRLDDDAVTAVVAAAHDAVMELEAARQRRTIENATFANIWRGP